MALGNGYFHLPKKGLEPRTSSMASSASDRCDELFF
jgi:hypothetical protein